MSFHGLAASLRRARISALGGGSRLNEKDADAALGRGGKACSSRVLDSGRRAGRQPGYVIGSSQTLRGADAVSGKWTFQVSQGRARLRLATEEMVTRSP